MRNKSLPFDNTKFWIFFLLILLVVVNSMVFHIYQKSHPSENLWTQLWFYFQSDTFKVITVSIILPIILFLLESLFKIRKAIEERIEKEKQARINTRWKCIEETSKIWNEFFGLISEVRYYKVHANKEKRETRIKKLLQRLTDHVVSWIEIVNKWHHGFPNLWEKDVSRLFLPNVLYFLNMLVHSTRTIAYSIQESKYPKKIDELQDTLSTIQGGVRVMLYHSLVSVLKDSIYVLEDGKKKGSGAEEHPTKVRDFEYKG